MKKICLLSLILIAILNHVSAQWEVNYIDSTSYSNLNVIRFYDNSLGLAMGSKSNIIRTTDQGENWQSINIDVKIRFADMQFINADTILAVGHYSEINGDNFQSKFMRSFDSGLTWDSINVFDEKQMEALHFFDAAHGLISGSRGIYKTNDGGFSWDTVYSVYQEGYLIGNVDNISFINDQTGFACMYGAASLPTPFIDNLILKTTDAGQTWTAVANLEHWSYSIEFYNDSIGYLSQANSLLKTEDGGVTWNEIISDVGGYEQIYFDIQCLNDSTAFFVGRPTVVSGDGSQGDLGFTFLKTTNGASNWDISDTLTFPLQSVYFINDSIGFMTGGNYIFKTNTCGGSIIGLPEADSTSSLKNLDPDIDLLVYPNPTSDFLHIKLLNTTGKSLIIYNHLGQLITHFTVTGSKLSFSTKNLSTGNYWLKIETDTGSIIRPFIKF